MVTSYVYRARVHGPRVVDITPVPWWRRAARVALAVLTFALVVPLLWLFAAALALAVAAGAAAILAAAMLRAGPPGRQARGLDGVAPPDPAP